MGRGRTPEPTRGGGLLVGALAAALGVTPKTLRHYERLGVVPPAGRTARGYRVYTAEAATRARLAVGLRALGFPLGTVRDLLAAADGATLRARLMALLDQRIAEATVQIAVLQGRRDEMEARLMALFDLSAGASAAELCQALLGPAAAPPAARAAPRRRAEVP